MIVTLTLAALAMQGAPVQDQGVPTTGVAPSAATLFVDRDTPIRLMVLNEVSSRTAQAGKRFVLRVDEPLIVDGVTIVPAGAKAWGEVTAAEESGAVGKAGRLQARLLHLDLNGQSVPITGERRAAGEAGGKTVGLAFFSLGPFALFAPGNNAKLKAGDLFSAYLTRDQLFDPASGKLTAAPEEPTAP